MRISKYIFWNSKKDLYCFISSLFNIKFKMFQNRFDEFYLTICKQVGGIQGLLKSFFDFMIRKTDFFYECDPGDKMGFPPGYNKKLLLGIFQKFQQQHYKRFPKKDPAEFDKKLQKFKQSKQSKPQPKTQKIENKQVTKQTEHEVKKVQQKVEQPKQEATATQKPVPQQKKTTAQPIISTYNGGSNDKYSWSQQTHDVEVTIEIQPGLTAKMINVSIKNDSVSIKKKTGEVVLQGQLYQKINAQESMWKIEKSAAKNLLTLNLEKAQDKIWSTVFKGDPEIDTTKVNNTKPLHQFDDETQGAIRKIMYEQQRKQMGLPTTDEEKQIQALKKAWDADGSPFKGQPFDPSKFNLQGSNFKPE